jgi:hypothetical protein
LGFEVLESRTLLSGMPLDASTLLNVEVPMVGEIAAIGEVDEYRFVVAFDGDLRQLAVMQSNLGAGSGATKFTGDLTGDGAVNRNDVVDFLVRGTATLPIADLDHLVKIDVRAADGSQLDVFAELYRETGGSLELLFGSDDRAVGDSDAHLEGHLAEGFYTLKVTASPAARSGELTGGYRVELAIV